MKKVFYSFHYENDYWRVNMIRNIGSIKGNQLLKPNKWEEIERQGSRAIEAWIDKELSNKCCTVVLVGAQTAERPWVQKEILKSWDKGMGVLAIAIDEIKNQKGQQAIRGNNPFLQFELKGQCFSEIAKFKEPTFLDELRSFLFGDASKDAYSWISKNLNEWVDEAITIRSRFSTDQKLEFKTKS